MVYLRILIVLNRTFSLFACPYPTAFWSHGVVVKPFTRFRVVVCGLQIFGSNGDESFRPGTVIVR